MTVEEFEKEVLRLERVRIVVRAPLGTSVSAYGRRNGTPENYSVTRWLRDVVRPKLPNGDGTLLEVLVLDGNLAVPHGRTSLKTLRETYR